MKPPVTPPAGLKTFPTAKKRRGTPEADFQRALVRDLRAILLPPFVLHHSANEVRRGGRFRRDHARRSLRHGRHRATTAVGGVRAPPASVRSR